MIEVNSKVFCYPKDAQVQEMVEDLKRSFIARMTRVLDEMQGDLVGTVIQVIEPPPNSHDRRTRYAVKLDLNHYATFTKDELEVVK